MLLRPEGTSLRLLLIDQADPSAKGWSDFTLKPSVQEVGDPAEVSRNDRFAVGPVPAGMTSHVGMSMLNFGNEESWELFPVAAPPMLVREPCKLWVDIVVDGETFRRGEVVVGFRHSPPITEDERRALVSRPGAAKYVIIQLSCKFCESRLTVYDSLEAGASAPSKRDPESIHIASAPDVFKCRCGETVISLAYLKLGLHDQFRRATSSPTDELRIEPLYEAGRLADILAAYEQLVDSATLEEPVQQYLQDNPVFWSFLSPIRVKHKPAVLTRKAADFAVLSAQKVLYLIELEKPSTKLVNADGSISAEIQKGANQIRDWQMVIHDHKLAFLAELDLKLEEVQEIRYVLVGGLARKTSPAGLTKIRRTPFAPNTDFYCFDELGSFLNSLSGTLSRL
jgi:hypothetical protein